MRCVALSDHDATISSSPRTVEVMREEGGEVAFSDTENHADDPLAARISLFIPLFFGCPLCRPLRASEIEIPHRQNCVTLTLIRQFLPEHTYTLAFSQMYTRR